MLKLLAFIVWNQSEWGWDPGIPLFPCGSLFSSGIGLSLLHSRKCSALAASQQVVSHRHWDRTSFSPLKPVWGAEDKAQQSSLLTKQTWWDQLWETSSILLSVDVRHWRPCDRNTPAELGQHHKHGSIFESHTAPWVLLRESQHFLRKIYAGKWICFLFFLCG